MRGRARFSQLGRTVAMWLSLLLVSASPPLLRGNSGEVDTAALREERSCYWWSNTQTEVAGC